MLQQAAMEALSRAASVADLIQISSAADWQGCDVRRFGWAAAAKLISHARQCREVARDGPYFLIKHVLLRGLLLPLADWLYVVWYTSFPSVTERSSSCYGV